MDEHIDALAQEALTYSTEHRRQFLREACPSTEVLEAVQTRISELQAEEGDTNSSSRAATSPSEGNERDAPNAEASDRESPLQAGPVWGPGWSPVPYHPETGAQRPDEPSSPPATEPVPGSDWPTVPLEETPDEGEEGTDRTRTVHPAGDSTTITQESAPSSESGDSTESSDRVDRIGPWRLVEVLGQGGMGSVYLAERADGQFQQQAALKLIRHDLGPDAQRRFLSERQILAQLQHPNIAHLLDGGVTDDGRPYFAMEYVNGTPIDTFCNQHELGVEERLRLFQQVGKAVQFAHSNLIVHRDLKPSNILVAEPSTDAAGPANTQTGTATFAGSSGPQVKLLDFGIAKALEGAEGVDSYTQTGEGSPLTPSYAAPEQVQGAAITTATDVYAMGVVLCELLTGCLPYDVRGRPPAEVTQIITEAEPVKPSELVERHPDTAVVTACGLSAEALQQRLQGDLDVIVQKALRKEPDRRYTSATDLGKDVNRHLEGLPVEARPATTGYRLRRFVERNRTTVLSAAGAVVALLVGLGVAIWQAQVAAAERDRAQQNANRAEAVRTFLVDMIERAAPATTGGEALTMREVLDEADAELESQTLQNQPEVSVEIRKTASEMYRHLEKGDAAVEQGRRAYTTGAQTLGSRDPLTLKAAATFGRALRYDSQLERADSLYSTVLARVEDVTAEPGIRASLLSGYGKLLQDLSRTDSAETVLLRALALHDQMAEPDTIGLVRTLGHLGHTHLYQGRFEDGEERYQRALSLVEQVSGDRNLLLKKDLLNDLAILYANDGQPTRAEEMYRRALRISKQLYGDGSADVAMILNNLSDVLEASGKLKEADRLSARSLALHRKHYSSSHQWVGYTLATRVEVLQALGRYETAISRAQEALNIFETSLGPNHPHALVSHGELADLYLETGALTKASRHAEEALAGFQAHYDDSTHTDIIKMKSRLGAIRTKQGRYEEAEELLLEARSTQSADSATVAVTRERLSTLYETWPRSEE